MITQTDGGTEGPGGNRPWRRDPQFAFASTEKGGEEKVHFLAVRFSLTFTVVCHLYGYFILDLSLRVGGKD